ncbi:DUF309 domain-containing protein [Paenibacillus sp. HJGM_3]|uniref:DUF309 domain-containing protein n=1 Tax=Paenibacillus sp. HJGM_3 TaxID=3379816 RepID=UPI003859BECF
MRTYPEAYLLYLAHFHGDRDWFECHELLEEYWKSKPADGYSRTWVGLIQIAVGLYHERRGNRSGAVKMLQASLGNLRREALAELGLDADETIRRVQTRLYEVESGTPAEFRDMNLPISDAGLLHQCIGLCDRLGMTWEAPSRLEDPELIHRHTRRDRTDVIEARRTEAERRRRQRGDDR